MRRCLQELQALSEAVGSVSRGVPQAVIDALPCAKYCSRFPPGELLFPILNDPHALLLMIRANIESHSRQQAAGEAAPLSSPLLAPLYYSNSSLSHAATCLVHSWAAGCAMVPETSQ